MSASASNGRVKPRPGRARGTDTRCTEAALLAVEPAYSDLAELGLGVLADIGVEPIGSVLLDEKPGLHIAFGRSEHFGGHVGPDAFSSPEAVVHIDRVYVPETHPDILPRASTCVSKTARRSRSFATGSSVRSSERTPDARSTAGS